MPAATVSTVTITTLVPVDTSDRQRCECGAVLTWNSYAMAYLACPCRRGMLIFVREVIVSYRKNSGLSDIPYWLRDYRYQ